MTDKHSNISKGEALHRLHAAIGLIFVIAFVAFGVISHINKPLAHRILVLLGFAERPASNAEMSVHFIDVGQGDCELIICGDEVCLIDCGEQDMGDRVAAYLKAQNITKLDHFIISHQHTDHMGCADRIIEDFEPGSIIMPQIPDELIPTNSVYEHFLDTAYEHGVTLYEQTEESVIRLGECEIYIYPQLINDEYESLNNYSLCIKVVYGDNSFLFTGDAEEEEELNLIDSGIDLSAKVLKANHHGSSGSNTYDFLKVVGAEYAVIEVGAGNSYGHPSRSVIKRLEKSGMQIYRTDIDGTVVFECDKESVNILTDKDK